MRSGLDKDHSERLQVGPGVWAYARPSDASVLKYGAMFAICLGLFGGLLAMAMIPSRDGFISFIAGYGGFGVFGMLIGLIFAGHKQNKTLAEKFRK
ncbi:hypothetical protein [Aliiroseovarius sp. S253]|uniref:hypothetical protein n=1 Tax=Aliiroseovarius sp. S253 TaxID=3415133 RepID=UPI003C7E4366